LLAISTAAGSVANVSPLLAIGWSSTAADVGGVAVLLAAYTFAFVGARAGIGDVLLLAHHPLARDARSAAGAAIATGAAAACLLAPLLAVMVARPDLVAVVCVALPLLLLQDALRYVAVTRGRTDITAAAGVAWALVAVLSGLGAMRQSSDTRALLALAGWAAGGGLSALGLVAALRVRPRLAGLRAHLSAGFPLRASLAGDALMTSGALQLTIVAGAVPMGLAGAGIVRLLQALFGPVTLLFSVLYVELIARHRVDEGQLTPVAAAGWMAAALLLATVGLSVLLLVVAEWLGVEGRATGFADMMTYLAPFAVSQAAAGLGTAAVIGLRLQDRAAAAALVRAGWAIGLVVATFVAAVWWNVAGYIWATTLVHAVAAAAWWRQLAMTDRDVIWAVHRK
jgi:hypothetical protein